MNAEIHARDTGRPDSEGNNLAVRGAKQLKFAIKRYEGLAFGEHKDQHYIEVRASSWEGGVESKIVAELSGEELQQLFDFARKQGMVVTPIDQRIRDLVEQLREAATPGA
jgi:hypothetical protein